MSLNKIESRLRDHLLELHSNGTLKGAEHIVTGIEPAREGYGPRYRLEGMGSRLFLRMNSNGYLGMAFHRQVIEAESRAAAQYGCGPGAVRFISGTYQPHVELEKKLAKFHGRETGMIFSSAYATVTGVLPQFISRETLVISDALNHNCIINAILLAQPAEKAVYAHLSTDELKNLLKGNSGNYKRVVVVTDGVFSMRGDHAPLKQISALCSRYEDGYEEGIITMVDDSHGVGTLGETGGGTEEYTQARADIYIATLGKALGVNGGYVVSSKKVIDYLRETSPFYIYSNPVTPAEAAAAITALEILKSSAGKMLLATMRGRSAQLRQGLQNLGMETIQGDHPIVPVLIRDTQQTAELVRHLFENNVLATGLNYPVVPKGEEEIRLQVSAHHTEKDIDYLLDVLAGFS
ncbi:aminotransferase class I/II-fold pyridoxal phosphate-dependent enzyme [Desulfogranum mediterraneum]|uniref:aminotransferase class I/II-fold pyridoxal phosphate-dependent enzyme n=1 Tax=Desulfogranum mediterraneum TaxID=160661 RepID=UPI00040F6112|nr:aminotransferase class I/II-fold pyridoxal phosphate-dependent enzyme [Desulfogranum mediterraneum]